MSVTGTAQKSTCSTIKRYPACSRRSTNTAFHLELDQPVHLDRVLERQLLGDRLHEAGDDHGARLRLGEAARHEVEELLLPDLRDGRLVPDVDLVLVDP